MQTLLSGCQCANGDFCARGELDKLCQVEDGPIGDSCEAIRGQEVTYIYRIFQGCPEQGAADLVNVFDDQFGEDPIFTDVPIGPVDTIELSLTTRIFETTTNTARATGNTSNECGVFGIDSVTVTVVSDPNPGPCERTWPRVRIVTRGKGQGPSDNTKVLSFIEGNVVDPTSLAETAHRIPICSGTPVEVIVTDRTGTPTVTPKSSGIACSGSSCSVGALDSKEKYTARSSDGKDTDRITLLPE